MLLYISTNSQKQTKQLNIIDNTKINIMSLTTVTFTSFFCRLVQYHCYPLSILFVPLQSLAVYSSGRNFAEDITDLL